MGISCPCYSILLREKVTCLTSGCDKARNVSKLPAFSAIELRRIILPLTPERGIHIMPPVNTTRFTLRGYSSAGRALAWHARGQRFDPAILHQSRAKRTRSHHSNGRRCVRFVLRTSLRDHIVKHKTKNPPTLTRFKGQCRGILL